MIFTHQWNKDTALVFVINDLNGAVPNEIQVIPYAVNKQTPKGIFTYDEESEALVLDEFKTHETDMVIDYEHQTLFGGEAPASGWVKRSDLFGKGQDGLWAHVEWTAKAREYIANKEYRYVSPVFLKRLSDNRVVSLINVALTNQPNIDGMIPIVNKLEHTFTKEVSIMKELLKLLGLPETATEQDAITAVNKLKVMVNKTVLSALGLADTATEQDAIAMVNKLKTPAQIVANKAVLTALGLADTATEAEITGTIMAMKQSHDQVGALGQELQTMKNKMVEKEAIEVVENAMKPGNVKILPAQKEWALDYAKKDMEGFKVYIAKAPILLHTERIAGDEKPGEGGIDEVQMQINKQMGIDTETFKKYNK